VVDASCVDDASVEPASLAFAPVSGMVLPFEAEQAAREARAATRRARPTVAEMRAVSMDRRHIWP
jgi:hypothetical protein